MKILIIIIALLPLFSNAAIISCIPINNIEIENGKITDYKGQSWIPIEVPFSLKNISKFENAKKNNIVTTIDVGGIDYTIIKSNNIIEVVGIKTINNIIVVYYTGFCEIEF